MNTRKCDTVHVPLPGRGNLRVYVSFDRERTDWAVLYVHGFGSTMSGKKSEAVERSCAKRGWTYASFDFRGHGQSTGTLLELSGSRLLEDLETVRNHLVERGIPKLCLVGSSMGGWASAWFTHQHPRSIIACVLIAPAFDFLRSRWEALSDDERERWRQTGRHRIHNQWVDAEVGFGMVEEIDLFPVDRLASGLARPMLIFHGLRDDVVPFGGSVAMLQQAAYPDMELRIYRDGDHRLLDYMDVIAESACEFFASRSRAEQKQGLLTFLDSSIGET